MAKFKCAPFLIIWILDIGTIFAKNNQKEDEYFKTENICLFLL